MSSFSRCQLLLLLLMMIGSSQAQLGVNWGTRASHRLPAGDVVRMLLENKFSRVKLLEPDGAIMKALGGSGVEVMVGIPNAMLEPLASSLKAAQNWVSRNVTSYLSRRKKFVNIRYVSVGNEPLSHVPEGVLLDALQNIQRSLDDQRTGVKATVPFSQGDVESSSGPSTGKFKDGERVREILIALSQAEAPFTINIHPFFNSLLDAGFPLEFAFFDNEIKFIVDGDLSYTNAFDATFDTVVAALQDAGFGHLQLIVGETGWPSDCESVANLVNARRFNQGLLDKLRSGRGTPLRPSSPPQVYLFALLDEDLRSTAPGNFERHWGMFYFDGKLKYDLRAGDGALVEDSNVGYLNRTWCVYNKSKEASEEVLKGRAAAACETGDCTPIYGNGSCSLLSVEDRTSYAFNNRYQFGDHEFYTCDYDYGMFVNEEPSLGDCRFPLQIQVGAGKRPFVMMSLITVLVSLVVRCL